MNKLKGNSLRKALNFLEKRIWNFPISWKSFTLPINSIPRVINQLIAQLEFMAVRMPNTFGNPATDLGD